MITFSIKIAPGFCLGWLCFLGGEWLSENKLPWLRNTNELQEWLAAPLTRVVELAKLFDPSGPDVSWVRWTYTTGILCKHTTGMMYGIYIYIHTYVYQIIKKLYIYHLSFWCLYLPSWNRWFVRWDRRCQPRRLRKGEYDQSKQGSQQSPCACGTFDFILPLGSFQVSLLKSRGKSLEFLWCIQWKDMNIKDQSILFCQNFSWNKMRYQRTQPRQMQPVLVQQPWYLYQGLIMSHTMSTRQKLQFLLGMFDLDDKDAL